MDNILKSYNIEFVCLDNGEPYVRNIDNSVESYAYFIDGYFVSVGFWCLRDEILMDLDAALKGNDFDPDGGGEQVFLTIGKELSELEPVNGAVKAISIPTADLKDIIHKFIEFGNLYYLNK